MQKITFYMLLINPDHSDGEWMFRNVHDESENGEISTHIQSAIDHSVTMPHVIKLAAHIHGVDTFHGFKGFEDGEFNEEYVSFIMMHNPADLEATAVNRIK